MPSPTFSDAFWVRLAKADYLEYRKLKSAQAGRRSAQMIASINALESKLAVRGHIPWTMQSQNIAPAARLAKTFNAPANNALASEKLDQFLKAKAIPLKEELDLLGDYLILSKRHLEAKWVAGPLKKLDKAMGKTIEDYDYAWTMNKDLVRGTIVCQTDRGLNEMADWVMHTCTDTYGMFLIKKDQQKSIRDGGQVKSGYSGWNFVIQFKDHNAFGVEVQANTIDMMYGKMSKKDFCKHLKLGESDYVKLQAKHRFPGALGHSLYDIQDIERSKCTFEEGNLARVLALDYNDACRAQFRKTTLDDLNNRIQQFGRNLTTIKAKELWKHDVDGSGWNGYPFLLTAADDYSFTVKQPGRVRLS